MAADTPEKRIAEALKRSLERSNFAVKRQTAELRDVADADWGGFRLNQSRQEWFEQLTPAQYRSTREKVADEPFAGDFERHEKEGIYHCACGTPLFHSDYKLESESGRPSFSRAVEPAVVVTDLGSDWSREHDRIELLCSICGGHLGHIDPGESPDDDLSFVVNSSALLFEPPASTTFVD